MTNDLPQVRQLFSLEAEQAVIGAALMDNETVAEVEALGLRNEMFFDGANRVIWYTITVMLEARKPVDVITVHTELESQGKGEQVGGLAYLGAVASSTPTVSNVVAYAEAVMNYAKEREWLRVCNGVRELFTADAGLSHMERLGKAESLLSSLTVDDRGHGVVHLNEGIQRYLEDLDERYNSDGGLRGLLTGYRHIDFRLNGLQAGNLLIVAGRPGMGKTTYAMNIALNAILRGAGAMVFSLEMPVMQLVQRLIAAQGRIKMGLLQTAKIDEDASGWTKITNAVTALKDKGMVIDDQAGVTIADIRARALREHRRNKLSVVVVDYIQLIESANNRDNVSFRIGEISRGLKLLAKEIDGVVIALSQVNRKCEERGNKRPNLGDLRDSGAIEQDADVVQFCYRDEYYNENTQAKGQIELITAKCRDGEPGTDYLIWQGQYNKIDDNPDPHQPPAESYEEFAG